MSDPVWVPGVIHWLWRGTIDATEPGYDPVEGDVVTIGAIDAKGDAGRADIPKLAEPVGAGEYAYQRVRRTLDAITWPAWRRRLDVDNVRLAATDFGAKAASEFDRTAESASGHVYGDLSGRVAFRRKDWMVWPATAPVDATIGNVAAGDVCPSGWELRAARDDVTTRVIVGRDNETPLVVDDPEGIGVFGVETWERTDLLPVDDFELSRIASRTLSVRSPDSLPRVAAVELDASTGSGDVAELLVVASPFTPSRFRCRHVTAARTVFDRIMLVVGIRHTLSPVDGWSARISLDDGDPFRSVDNPARWSDPASTWSSDDQWASSL